MTNQFEYMPESTAARGCGSNLKSQTAMPLRPYPLDRNRKFSSNARCLVAAKLELSAGGSSCGQNCLNQSDSNTGFDRSREDDLRYDPTYFLNLVQSQDMTSSVGPRTQFGLGEDFFPLWKRNGIRLHTPGPCGNELSFCPVKSNGQKVNP
jgi:hypothetical protein